MWRHYSQSLQDVEALFSKSIGCGGVILKSDMVRRVGCESSIGDGILNDLLNNDVILNIIKTSQKKHKSISLL